MSEGVCIMNDKIILKLVNNKPISIYTSEKVVVNLVNVFIAIVMSYLIAAIFIGFFGVAFSQTSYGGSVDITIPYILIFGAVVCMMSLAILQTFGFITKKIPIIYLYGGGAGYTEIESTGIKEIDQKNIYNAVQIMEELMILDQREKEKKRNYLKSLKKECDN